MRDFPHAAGGIYSREDGGYAAGTQAFRETWVRMADQLCGLAEEDEARGRLLSAGEKYRRASNYLTTAERLIVLPAIALMFVLGIYPQLAIGLTNSTVLQMVEQLKF